MNHISNKEIYDYLESYSKKYNFTDNMIFNEIFEKKFNSHFILTNENKIIHASKKYEKIIGCELTARLNNDICRNNSCSGRLLSIEIIKDNILVGRVYYKYFKKDQRNGAIFLFYNPNFFCVENLTIIDDLIKYVYLL